jgi:hypothetical protein
VYRNLLQRASAAGDREIRRAVRRQLGGAAYARVGAIRLAYLPNQLDAVGWRVRGYTIEKIFSALGITPQPFNPFHPFDVIVNWQDLTVNVLDAAAYIERSYAHSRIKLPADVRFVNFRCLDISKRRIAQINERVFGYALDVDPTTHSGPAVCKSDANATRDGVLIDCPIPADRIDPTKVYNLVIANLDAGEGVDFRVPWIGGFTGHFFEVRRPLEARFGTAVASARIRRIEDEFSPEEMSRLAQVCGEVGADYGELDVLRDRVSGRLYVVDFAKTPAGPPRKLSAREKRDAIAIMATAFARNILLKS